MIEMKDAGLSVGRKRLFGGLSFHVADGQVVGVTGGRGCGKSSLIEAFLGLRPLASGFVTVDGEPVLPQTAVLFRGMMAYVPQYVRVGNGAVSDLFDTVAGLRVNDGVERPVKRMLAEWKRLGLAAELYDRMVDDVDDASLRMMMLGVAGMSGRPVVLLDEPTSGLGPVPSRVVADYVRSLAHGGAAVLVATADKEMARACDRILDLDAFNNM